MLRHVILSASLIGACFREPELTQITYPAKIIVVDKKCVAIPPPKQPTGCSPGIPVEDCPDIERAMWSDYGHLAAEYINLTVWPKCEVTE